MAVHTVMLNTGMRPLQQTPFALVFISKVVSHTVVIQLFKSILVTDNIKLWSSNFNVKAHQSLIYFLPSQNNKLCWLNGVN